MNINMKYGKTGLSLDLPGDIDVTLIQKETMPVLKDRRELSRQLCESGERQNAP